MIDTSMKLVEGATPRDVTFLVKFANTGSQSVELQKGRLLLSAERVGLHIESPTGSLEPVEYRIVNSAARPEQESIFPGQSIEVSLIGRLEKKGRSIWALVFPQATFVVEPRKKYRVFFWWDKLKSNSIEWSFDGE